MKTKTLLSTFYVSLFVPIILLGQETGELPSVQNSDLKAYGKPNPNAPKELSQFAFIIGKWQGEGKRKGKDDTYKTYQMTWVGRYILDGYAIADEYRQRGENGKWKNLGVTYRFYNRDQNR